MQHTDSKTITIFGTGPGIGQAVAAEFATRGFDHVILLARNLQRLEDAKANILHDLGTKTVRISTVTVDLSEPESITNACQHLDQLSPIIEVVLYNAARVAPTSLFDTAVKDIEQDFKVCRTLMDNSMLTEQTTVIGPYLVAKWAVPKLQKLQQLSEKARPSLLVTGGDLHIRPIPEVFSLSVTKTAQRNLVQNLHLAFGQEGIHIGSVIVSGPVSEDKMVLNPSHIAEAFWSFFDDENYKDSEELVLEEPSRD